MPIMTEPLAHLEVLLSSITADLDDKKAELDRLKAKIDVLNDYRYKVRDALDEERAKLTPSFGDKQGDQHGGEKHGR